MAKAIGPTFGVEISAAGLGGLPFSWGADGVLQFDSRMTQAQIDAVNAVYAAHDPTKGLPDADGFEADLRTQFVTAGDPVALNALLTKAPLLWWALRDRNWAYLQRLIIAAHAAFLISDAQYAAIKTAASARSLPITLL